jgi:hypothetical protein
MGTSQNSHRRDVQDASVVKTFSVNSLIDNERALEKPPIREDGLPTDSQAEKNARGGNPAGPLVSKSH